MAEEGYDVVLTITRTGKRNYKKVEMSETVSTAVDEEPLREGERFASDEELDALFSGTATENTAPRSLDELLEMDDLGLLDEETAPAPPVESPVLSRVDGWETPERQGSFHEAELSKFREVLAEKAPHEFSLEEIESAGAAIDDLIQREAALTGSSREELYRVAGVTSQFFSSLTGTHELKNSVSGSHGKALREAVSVLPTSAFAYAKGDYVTSALRGHRDAGAMYYSQIKKAVHREERPSGYIPEGTEEGEFVFNGVWNDTIDAIRTGQVGNFALAMKVTRAKGKSLRAGEAIDPFTSSVNLSAKQKDEKYIELLQAGVFKGDGSGNFVLVEGKEEEFERIAPEFAEAVRSTPLVKSYYVGGKPRAYHGKLVKSKEVARVKEEEFTGVPLYEAQEETMVPGHAIMMRTSKHSRDYKSHLTHEFTHSIQSSVPGGIPGEREMILQAQREGAEIKSEIRDGREVYRYVDGFPDQYMGDIGGHEVFTRATEGLFYPHADNEFLYDGSPNGERVRRWALGAWAILAVNGEEKRKADA